MKGKIELYNISFLILKVELHFNTTLILMTSNMGLGKLDISDICFRSGQVLVNENYYLIIINLP